MREIVLHPKQGRNFIYLVYRANPFNRQWEFWDHEWSGWSTSVTYDDTPLTPTGEKIIRRDGDRVVSYEATWCEPYSAVHEEDC